MKPKPPFHKHIRLHEHDYSSPGAYFVTMVVLDRKCCLCDIRDEQAHLTGLGEIVVQGWNWLARQYSYVTLDQFVVMPNHVHGIICITNDEALDGQATNPVEQRLPLGRLVSAFKSVTTREVNCLLQTPGRKFWQDDFYEHIIRNERDMAMTRQYIASNPQQWRNDKENPFRTQS